MKKLICVFTAVFMLLLSFSVAADSGVDIAVQRNWTKGGKITSTEYEVVTENDAVALSVNGSKGTFSVTDKKSGKVWYSNPELTKEEVEAVKLGLGKINSQVCITYLTAERTDGSVNGNIAKKVVEEYLVNGKCQGFVITYNFDKDVLQFEIPVAYSITETGMRAEILFEDVKEKGTSQLNTVELLPMFGAAKASEDGYLFIPDGSGAIVDYKGITDAYPDYSEMIYGADSSVDLDMRNPPPSQGIKMPVFGAKNGDSAFFAIITSSDATAKLNATSSVSAYNVSSVWPTFYYREFDEIGIMSKDSVKRAVRMLDRNIASENPVVEYNFLSGEDASYSGMARFYRDYLVKKYSLEKVDSTSVDPVLQAFGKTYSSESFFGIPIKKAVAATTLADLEGFYNTLKENGVEQSKFFLYGFNKSGYQNKYVSKFAVDSKVGGKRGLASLAQTVGKNNVFMSFNMLHDYNYGGLFADSKYAAALNKVTIVKQNGMVSTGAWKGSISWKLISNHTLNKFGTKLVNSIDPELGVGVSFENMGSELYNDFDEKYCADRNQYLDTYNAINKAAADKGVSVGTDGSNIYMLEQADLITEVPLYSSDKLLFTDHVPFYAMVVHGYADISSKPFNNSADIAADAAICAQLGIMPTYRVTAVDSNSLQVSNLNFLFNSKFSSWEKIIVENYKLINSVSEGLNDKLIVSHEYIGELSVVEYENGVRIVYNQSETETVQFEGKEIAPGAVVRF